VLVVQEKSAMSDEKHQSEDILDKTSNADTALGEKLADAEVPGYQAEFDPDEAERAGAFVEDAMSEVDALESAIDQVEAAPAEQTTPRTR
jgi:hypothetical protein